MNANRIFKNLLSDKSSYYLFFLIIVLSLFTDSVLNRSVRNVMSNVIHVGFLVLIIYRIRFLEDFSFKKVLKSISFDEFIVMGICFVGIIAALCNDEKISLEFQKPLLFLLSYIGISSFIKTVDIDDKTILRILSLYVIIILMYSLAEFIFSSKKLFSYITGETGYLDYVNSSWNMLYPNYSYFARSVMVGLLAGMSVCMYYVFEITNMKKGMILFLISIFFCLIILLSFNRSSILTMVLYACLLLFYAIINHKGSIKKIITIKTATICILIILSCVLILNSFGFINEIYLKTKIHGSTYRFGLWNQFVLKEIDIFPSWKFFIGHGYMNKSSDFYNIWSGIDAKHVHNNFFFIWYNYGFISMVFFIVLLIKIWINCYKIINKIWFIYFISISFMCVISFESIITRKNFRFDVIFFILFLTLPYNMFLRERKVRAGEIK